jgi:hypothetical protein
MKPWVVLAAALVVPACALAALEATAPGRPSAVPDGAPGLDGAEAAPCLGGNETLGLRAGFLPGQLNATSLLKTHFQGPHPRVGDEALKVRRVFTWRSY